MIYSSYIFPISIISAGYCELKGHMAQTHRTVQRIPRCRINVPYQLRLSGHDTESMTVDDRR